MAMPAMFLGESDLGNGNYCSLDLPSSQISLGPLSGSIVQNLTNPEPQANAMVCPSTYPEAPSTQQQHPIPNAPCANDYVVGTKLRTLLKNSKKAQSRYAFSKNVLCDKSRKVVIHEIKDEILSTSPSQNFM